MPRIISEPFDFEAFHTAGFAVWKGVVPDQMADRAIERAMALSSARQGKLAPAMQPQREDPGFLELMRHAEIVSTVEALVGGAAAGLQVEFFYTMPGTRGFSAHQDNFFAEAPSEAFVSVWVALTDIGPHNGGLIGWPGSHRLGRLPVRPTGLTPHPGQDANANNEEIILPEGLTTVDVVAPKGSAVFLHSLFVHASHPNRSEAPRYVQLNTYIRVGAPFRPGNTAQRQEIALHA